MSMKQQQTWNLNLVNKPSKEIEIRPQNPTKINYTLYFWEYQGDDISVEVHFTSDNSNPPPRIQLEEYGPRRKALVQSPDEPLAIAGVLVKSSDIVRTLFVDTGNPPAHYLIRSCPHDSLAHDYEDGFDDCRKNFLRDVDHYVIH